MKEFWPELLTKASWEKLIALKKEIKKFIVIGGWAVYLWTGMHKSKDIDIIVDLKTLDYFKKHYCVEKNESIKKYQIKFDKFDIDIYVPYFSRFIIPVEELMKHTKKVSGFEVLEPEFLVIIKQSAQISRKESVKGEKDVIDILALIIKAPFDIKKYFSILKKYKVEHYAKNLLDIIRGFDAKRSEWLGMNFKEFKTWQKNFLKELKQIPKNL